MVGSPLAAFTNSAERLIARKSYVDYCTILEVDKDGTDGVKCHSPDHPEYYNTVSLKIRSTKLVHEESQDPNAIQHVNALILQTFVGNCFGEPYIPRVGDLVAVLFMYNEKPLVLGPVATIQQPPVMRAPTSEDAKYDYVNKWCQWLRPEKDKNYDYFNHPQGKKPICFKRFHGPVTGSTGIGRDEMTVWDCQKGDADPTCAACSNIDSVPRSGEQWNKIYSTQTESEEAYNSRMELHARCGSYFRVESDNTNESSNPSSEYSENIGHIRLGNALTEADKRFHFNVQGNRYGNNGVGSFDLHTNHEEVQIASESTGVRFAGIRPEDSQVDWAYEFMNFPTTSFIRCYKNGIIEINSLDGDSSITVDGTAKKVTVDGTVNVELIASSEVTCTTPLTHVTGNMQIDGSCTHGPCSCGEGGGVSAGGVEGGQTICGDTLEDGELTLQGTADASKGTVKVDADLSCTGSCQLPTIYGTNAEDGELTLCGTSDVSKGQVTVDSDLECTGALGTTLKSSIKSYCDGLYSDSGSGVTNGDSHDHSDGDGAQIDHGGLNGLSDDDHSQYVKLAGRSGGQTIQGGTASGDDLILESTANATKGIVCIGPGNGKIYIGEDPYDATNAVAGWGFQRYTDGSLYTAWKTVTGGSIKLRCGAGAEPGYARTFLTITPSTGACYFLDNVSALSFTDRTPGYNGDALAELKNVVNDAQGRISHKTLPAFARATFTDQATGQQTECRNIGNMVSILTKAIQQLTEKLEIAEKKISDLENTITMKQ